MEILKNKNIQNFGVYMIGNLLNSAIPFLLLPILTSELSKAEMGILSMLDLFIGICLPIATLSTGSAITRYYYELSGEEHRKMMYNHLLLLFAMSTILTLLLVILDPYLKTELNMPANIIWLVVLIALAKQLLEAVLTMFRVTEKPIEFGLTRILSSAFDLAISMLLVILIYESWEGRFYGQLIAYSFFGVLSIIILIRKNWIQRGYSRQHMKKMLVYGLPLVPHAFGGILLSFGDRWLINEELGLGATGVYYVGYQVGMVMSLVQTSFNQAWSPWFYRKLSNPKDSDKKLIVRLTYQYSLALCGFALAFYLVTPLLFDWFIDTSFDGAEIVVIWVLIGYAFNGMYKMMVNYLLYAKRTGIVGALTIFTAIVNIILNIILIPDYGIVGAAQATAISFLLQLILTTFFAVSSFPMPWTRFRNDR